MNKGVSDIVAALILILIASTLGLSLYLFFVYQFSVQVDNLSSSIQYYEDRLNTRYKVVWYRYDTTASVLTLFIYNYGANIVEIDSIYIDGNRYIISPPKKILIDKIDVLEYEVSLTPGRHSFRLVSTNGVAYEFKMEI